VPIPFGLDSENCDQNINSSLRKEEGKWQLLVLLLGPLRTFSQQRLYELSRRD